MLKLLSITAALLTLLLGGCSDSRDSSNQEGDALLAKTVYALEDINGTRYEVTKSGSRFTLSGVTEPVIVYDIFATWCPPCRAEAPHLSTLQSRLAGKVKFIGLSIEEGKDNAFYHRFAKDIGINYTLMNAPDNQKLSRALAAAAGVGQNFPIPLMVVYKNGAFVKFYTGLIPEEMLQSDLEMIIEAP